LARIEAARSVTTVGQLADEYFERMIIRTKTGQPLDIPMPTLAVEWLQNLKELERQGPHPKKPAPAHQQASLPQEG
jgi:hypothetical protein